MGFRRPAPAWAFGWRAIRHGRYRAAAAITSAGSLAGAAWAVVPLLQSASGAATNEPLRRHPARDGYGTGVLLGWLRSGALLDYGRFPAITILAGIGAVALIVAARPVVFRFRAAGSSAPLLTLTLIGPLVLGLGAAARCKRRRRTARALNG